MIVRTTEDIEGEPCFPMCHPNLVLSTIHNNDEMHYYIVFHVFYLYSSSIGNLICHTLLVNATLSLYIVKTSFVIFVLCACLKSVKLPNRIQHLSSQSQFTPRANFYEGGGFDGW